MLKPFPQNKTALKADLLLMCEQIQTPETCCFKQSTHSTAAVWHADEVIHLTEPAMSVGLLPEASRQHETGNERMLGRLNKAYLAKDRIRILVSKRGSL